MSTTVLHHSCEDDSTARYTIAGQVRLPNGNPVSGVSVVALERGLRSNNTLAKAQTDHFGHYSLSFSASDLKLAQGGHPSIQLQVLDSSGAVMGRSRMIFRLQERICIDIVLGAAEYHGPSEYEAMVAQTRPLLGD